MGDGEYGFMYVCVAAQVWMWSAPCVLRVSGCAAYMALFSVVEVCEFVFIYTHDVYILRNGCWILDGQQAAQRVRARKDKIPYYSKVIVQYTVCWRSARRRPQRERDLRIMEVRVHIPRYSEQ